MVGTTEAPLNRNGDLDERANQIMRRMGFPDDARGKYVDELRHLTAQQVRNGLQSRSGGSWAEGSEALPYNQRARHLLAWEWELQNGHSYRVEAIDGLRFFKYDMKRRRRILHTNALAWLGDRSRQAFCELRVFWHRRVIGRTNPYTPPHRSNGGRG